MQAQKWLPVLMLVWHWQATLAQPIETIVQRNGGDECRDLAISSDGLLLAKVPESIINSEIEIWSTKTGHLLRVIKQHDNGLPGSAWLNSIQSVRFYRGSSQIITGTNDGEHEIYDVSTGKLIRKLPFKTALSGIFAVCSRTGTMAAVHIMGVVSPSSLLLIDIFSNSAFDSMQLRTAAITALEFSPKGDALAVGTKDGKIHVFNFPAFDSTRTIEGVHDTAITFLQWTDDNYLLVTDQKIFSLWNMTTNKIQSNGYLRNGKKMLSDPKEDSFYELDDNKLVKRTGSRIRQKEFGVPTDRVQQMKMNAQQTRMYVITDQFVRVWDMENLVQTECIKKDLFLDNAPDDNMMLIPDLRAASFKQGKNIVFKFIDSSAATIRIATDTVSWNNYTLNKHYLPALSAKGKLTIWKDSINKVEVKTDQPAEFILTINENTGTVIAAANNDSIVKFYSPQNGPVKSIKVKGRITCATVHPSKKLMAVGGDNLFLIADEAKPPLLLHDSAKEIVQTVAFGVTSSHESPKLYTDLLFSPTASKLYALSTWTGIIKVWDVQKRKIDTALSLSIVGMALSPDGKRLFAASNNEIIWINTADYRIEGRTAFLSSGDHITLLPGFQYKASANGSKAVAFRKGSQIYSFDQFDLQYNRPDVVTQQLGRPSSQMVETMQKLLAKRWQRLHYSPEKTASQLLEAPEVSIRNLKNIPGTVTQRKLSFVADMKDKLTPLATANVLINGVAALIDRNGTRLQADTSNFTEGTINFTVYLDSGNNLIEVYCTNSKGIESQRESFEVFYAADTGSIRSTTYFVGIGAGKYMNNQFDLKYPVKDVRDMAGLFAAEPGKQSRLKVKLLTDEEVTRNNVLAIKKMLDSSSIDDKIIICWSGHGILNKSLDYYLATYDTDFGNPEQNAINYTELANLLDNTPARKRVLFLDACHSGELDKDESQIVAGNPAAGDTTSGAKSSIKKSGLKNTPALLNDMFADIRRNSGANIISAAGGAEYALESDTWKNGVFTFCLLDALGNRNADRNKDNFISIKELQNYLQIKVPELTQGRQKPTSRTENLVNDWIIW